jgi:hypothetical protein
MDYAQTAETRMSMTGWTETVKEDIDEGAGTTNHGVYYPKRGLTHVEATFAYAGEMEGTSTVQYLISYKEGGAPVMAFERFVGSIGGRQGSCVFWTTGTQSPGSVKGHSEVVPGLGTGELETLRGELDLSIEGMSNDGYPLTLRYDVD